MAQRNRKAGVSSCIMDFPHMGEMLREAEKEWCDVYHKWKKKFAGRVDCSETSKEWGGTSQN